MDARWMQHWPMRRPQWRLDRVLQMVRQRPQPSQPTRTDCHYIRVYRWLLLALAAARRNEPRRAQIVQEFPELYQAHRLHYSADVETRQIVEARLLTSESFEEIAVRFGTTPKTIEYYEALFFNVRDRLSSGYWIRKVIRGNCELFGDSGTDSLSVDQRGYVLRLFAYFGGPLVLDAMLSGLLEANTPPRDSDIDSWFDDALNQLVRTTALAAASAFSLNQRNIIPGLQLAMKNRSSKGHTGPHPGADLDQRVDAALEWLTQARGEMMRAPKQPATSE